jgi:hypothetical protein
MALRGMCATGRGDAPPDRARSVRLKLIAKCKQANGVQPGGGFRCRVVVRRVVVQLGDMRPELRCQSHTIGDASNVV